VIKIVLQFCKENSLNQTFQTLQSECQMDFVLPQVSQLKLPRNKLKNLLNMICHSTSKSHGNLFSSQIVLEMIELRELDTTRAILRQTQVMGVMKQEEQERYLRMEHLLVRSYFDPRE
ncbi:unnamed protein product, partial [Brassica oleracea var. botrytis]